jgi:hypothetical protein
MVNDETEKERKKERRQSCGGGYLACSVFKE